MKKKIILNFILIIILFFIPTVVYAGCSICGKSVTDAGSIIGYDSSMHYTGECINGHYQNGSGHSFTYTTDSEPSCTSKGYGTKSCSQCGYSTTYSIPKTGHSAISDYDPPSCTTSGYYYSYCSVCYTDLGSYSIPATGHTASSTWEIDDGEHWKLCTVCGQIAVAKTAHTDSEPDGYCDVCGYLMGTSITLVTVSSISAQTYTGSAITPKPTLIYDGATLRENVDYKLSYTNNTNKGTATITITGIGLYYGTREITFSIGPKALQGNTTATLGTTTYTYDGNAKTPGVTVKDNARNVNLVKDTDYTVTYTNNTNAGMATVTITGKGNYTGSLTLNFTINKKSVTVPTFANKTYTGSAQGISASTGYSFSGGTTSGTNVDTYTTTAVLNSNYIWNDNTTTNKTITWKIVAKSIAGSNTTLTLGQTSYVYSGGERKPGVTLKDVARNVNLSGTNDYTVAYSANTNVGTATVTVTGKGNYTGSKSTTFTITQKAMEGNVEITFSDSSLVYTGSARTINVTARDTARNVNLTNNTDYTVSYTNNVNVGTATVTITGKGNYSGTTIATFEITPKSISGGNVAVSVAQATYTYDGTEKNPAVTVKDMARNVNLTKDTDYTATYYNNVNVGTAIIIITGTGNYKDTASITFSIGKKQVTIPSFADQTYDGTVKSVSASSTVYTLGGTTSETNAGTHTAIASLDDSNYEWSDGTETDKNISWKIKPKSISGVTMTLASSSVAFDGSAKTPGITVKDPAISNATLRDSYDYTISYTNNTSVGTARLTITGTGNYSGTKSTTFTITKRALSGNVTVTVNTTTCVYTGSALTSSVTVRDNGRNVNLTTSDYSVSYANNVNVGTANITITGKGNYEGTVSATFEITPKSVSGTNTTVTVSPTAYTYDGTAKTPGVTVKDVARNVTLTNNVDYTFVYANNVDVGTASVIITGMGNYQDTTLGTFAIQKKSVSIPSFSDKVYNGTTQTVTSASTAYTLSGSTSGRNVGSYTVTATLDGNYAWSDGTEAAKNITWKITPKNIGGATVLLNPNSYIYTGSENKPTVSAIDNETGNDLVNGTDFTVSYANNVSAGTATATITGKGNYTGSKGTSFTISTKPISGAITVQLNPTTYVYDGSAKTPSVVSVKDNARNVTLTYNVDYTYTYSNNTNAGTAYVALAGKGNYSGTENVAFTITPKSVSGGNVSLSLATSSYTYDGTAKEPGLTARDVARNVTLSFDSDYAYEYENNTNAGTASVKVTGKNNYKDTATINFTINRKKISIPSFDDKTYNGSEQGITSSEGYAFQGGTTKAENADTYTATAVLDANYMWSNNSTENQTITWKITPRDLAEYASIIISDLGQVYDGTGKTPNFSVRDDELIRELTVGTDYTAEYQDNVNAGRASVLVTGKNNYKGTKSASFTIDRKDTTLTIDKTSLSLDAQESDTVTYTYEGDGEVTAICEPEGGAIIVIDQTNKTITITGVKAGTTTITISALAGTNYNATANKTVTLSVRDNKPPESIEVSTEYVEDNAKLTIVATDSGSGITSITVGERELPISTNELTGTATGEVIIYEKGEYVITATDGFGNERSKTIHAYEISYDANSAEGVSGTMFRQIKIEDVDIPLKNNTFRKTGHNFENWNTKADLSGNTYAGGATYTGNEDVTMYANWSTASYVVTFYNDDGVNGNKIVDRKTYQYGSLISVPINQEKAPVELEDGTYIIYRHKGWNPEKLDETAKESPIRITERNKNTIKMIDSNVNYYATYTALEYSEKDATVNLQSNAEVEGSYAGVRNIEGVVIVGREATDSTKPVIKGNVSIENDNGLVLWYRGILQGPMLGSRVEH